MIGARTSCIKNLYNLSVYLALLKYKRNKKPSSIDRESTQEHVQECFFKMGKHKKICIPRMGRVLFQVYSMLKPYMLQWALQ